VEGLEERCLLATGYLQLKLISDQPAAALVQDANLQNPWGIAHSSTSPNWVADNATGVSTLYDGSGNAASLVVTIPPPSITPDATAAPTGIIFSASTSDFMVTSASGKSGPARFIFATEDGTISGWSPAVDPTNAILAVDDTNLDTGPVYKGLALATNSGANFLYATDFRTGMVDVFDNHFKLVKSFTDPSLPADGPGKPAGLAPFGIQNINNQLYVTFALQDDVKHDDVAGTANGRVDIFNPDGSLVKTLISGSQLNSPWGVALAPANFGDLSNDLLVGNFGNGLINAFNPSTGAFVSRLNDGNGSPIVIESLWGLSFGNGAAAGATNALNFSAGTDREQHGTFGVIQAVGTTPLAAAAANLTATEGQAFNGTVAALGVADPTHKSGDFTATIDWGDGSPTTGGTVISTQGGTFLVMGDHTYTEDGTQTIKVTISDGTNTISATSKVTVADAPLSAAAVPVSVANGLTAINATVGTFIDQGGIGPASSYTATIDWGDGSQAATGTVATQGGSTFAVSGTHAFANTGSFTVKVTVKDMGGATTTFSTTASVGAGAFLDQVYRDLLQRPIDAAGLRAWSAMLDQGHGRIDVVLGIENSTEYRGDVIQKLYSQLLGRTADQSGLNAGISFMANGGTVEQVKAALLGSSEFFMRAGATTDGFLQALYHAVFGPNRTVDPSAEATLGMLLAGGTDRSTVAGMVLNSLEATQQTVQGFYQLLLHRSADIAGRDFFVNLLQNRGRDEQIIADLAGSGEYLTRPGG
jgi:uncharacterized protein (TIGR03118 family)